MEAQESQWKPTKVHETAMKNNDSSSVGNQLKNGLDLIIDYFGCFWLD